MSDTFKPWDSITICLKAALEHSFHQLPKPISGFFFFIKISSINVTFGESIKKCLAEEWKILNDCNFFCLCLLLIYSILLYLATKAHEKANLKKGNSSFLKNIE